MNNINSKYNEAVSEIIKEIHSISHLPFPYADCRKLVRSNQLEYEDLIPELDYYFSTIAGYCSWKYKILDWSDEQIHSAMGNLQEGFFEKRKLFSPLQSNITMINTPVLLLKLTVYDTLKSKLLDLLNQILDDRTLTETA